MDNLINGDLTGRILSAALSVHRALGPGLLESVYKQCLAEKLRKEGLRVQVECPVSIRYEELEIEDAYRADLVVEDAVIVELKSIHQILRIHEAQVLTYLKLSGLKVGLLINFNVPNLKSGVRRFVV